ncbi:MAG: hypothetical protein KGH59_01295 [Candidatus Micrarchaeota archaeon]|nr:hypothetical protein [Candidatus Micrarchaeota archaeon]
MATQRLQSVIEYLSTYSWAILAAAVIVGIMFALGIFSNPIPIQSCILVPGYICSHPILTNQGLLTFNLSYVGQTITVTGIGCNSGNTPPATLQSANFVLTSNKGTSITVECPISSNAFGTAFQGHLWLQYNTQTQSNLVSDIGVILGAVNTQTSTSTTSTSTTSTTSTSTTSSTSTSTTSSTSTSTSTTSTTSSSTTTTVVPPNPLCGTFSGDAVYSSGTTLTCSVVSANSIIINSGVTINECGSYLEGNVAVYNFGTITDNCAGGSGGGGGAAGTYYNNNVGISGSPGANGASRTSAYLSTTLSGGKGGAGSSGTGYGGAGGACDSIYGDNEPGAAGASGGSGGGIVEIYAGNFINNGIITVSGQPGAAGIRGNNGYTTTGGCGCGTCTFGPYCYASAGTSGSNGGGGGQGGTILIGYVNTLTLGTSMATGGAGGIGGGGGSGLCASSGSTGATGTAGGNGQVITSIWSH